jgi:hypothetical protein
MWTIGANAVVDNRMFRFSNGCEPSSNGLAMHLSAFLHSQQRYLICFFNPAYIYVNLTINMQQANLQI